MSSQSSAASTSTTDRGGPSEPKRGRSRRSANIIENINQEELDDGILEKKPKPNPKPPMEIAFQNDVVLLQIFRHSSPSDLKEFRLVNRLWNDTATSTLLSRKCLELNLGELHEQDTDHPEFTSDPMTYTLRKPSQRSSANGSLYSLTDICGLIESSVKFPTQSLTLQSKNGELHPQVIQLLKIFGNKVKELTFHCRCKVSTSCLRELLLVLVPNLENLIINSTTLVEKKKKQPLSSSDPDRDSSVDCDRIQFLPQLKQLIFLPCDSGFNLAKPKSNYLLCMEFFKELVDAAVNLQSVYALPLDFQEVLLDIGKVHLVKKLAFRPTTEVEKRLRGAVQVTYLASYQKLASLKPEIKKLKMQCVHTPDEFRPRPMKKSMFESTLNSILESSKDSLLDFKMELLPGFSIHLPAFPNLKKLEIILEDNFRGDLRAGMSNDFPTFSFQRNFPHLHELHLSLCSYMEVDIKDLFRGELEEWMSPTVKHLTLEGDLSFQGEGQVDSPYNGPGMLGKMFPNATSVYIVNDQFNNMHEDKQLSPIIWHQIPAGVKRLSITDFDAIDPAQDVVDPFFTGMSVKMCKKLRKFPQRICGENDSATLGGLRTGPSICDFKNLEELNICCYNLQSDQPFASHVTGLYAFGLMPQLKVTVTYEPEVEGFGNTTPSQDMERSLKHIAPFITQVCQEEAYMGPMTFSLPFEQDD